MSYADIRAKKGTASPLIKPGDKKLTTDDVENKILTVTGVDLISTKGNGECGLITFKEIPNAFYFCGKFLTDMCRDFLNDEEALSDLNAGKVRIRIYRTKSKTGNTYVTFEYVTEEAEQNYGFVDADVDDLPFKTE
ncbi:MAG: hypothetical protein J5517_07365 [Eubacterium sp.]|nr:hypothetical protein [Eubacterium sp.]